MKPVITPEEVLRVLMAHHRGQAHGATARVLVAEITQQNGRQPAQERKLRDAITALRLKKHPVCGTPDTGYFYAATREELNETCKFLRDRAMTTLKQVDQLRSAQIQPGNGQQLNLLI